MDRQNHLLQHTTNIYLNNEIAEYAQELTATLPGNLNVSCQSLALHVHSFVQAHHSLTALYMVLISEMIG